MICVRRTVIAAAAALALLACTESYDPSYPVDVAQPAYTTSHPRVLFDEAHHNSHTSKTTYRPFAKLLKNDGYKVIPLHKDITPFNLSSSQVLVIVSATSREPASYINAFTESECDALEAWVRGGGALLLVTGFSDPVHPLMRRFGVEPSGAIAFDGGRSDLVFSKLPDHPVTRSVRRIMTSGSESVRGGVPLLPLSDTAVNRQAIPHGTSTGIEIRYGDPEPARGWSQGVALEVGRGRVIVLTDPSTLIPRAGSDNRQFALNAMHWLTRHS